MVLITTQNHGLDDSESTNLDELSLLCARIESNIVQWRRHDGQVELLGDLAY